MTFPYNFTSENYLLKTSQAALSASSIDPDIVSQDQPSFLAYSNYNQAFPTFTFNPLTSMPSSPNNYFFVHSLQSMSLNNTPRLNGLEITPHAARQSTHSLLPTRQGLITDRAISVIRNNFDRTTKSHCHKFQWGCDLSQQPYSQDQARLHSFIMLRITYLSLLPTPANISTILLEHGKIHILNATGKVARTLERSHALQSC